ncbi:transposase, partial [Klebsiella pneumoniae]|nr:transposase [Klebsiella pneumoniae]
DGSNPSAAIVQSASDVQCSRLLKTTVRIESAFPFFDTCPRRL